MKKLFIAMFVTGSLFGLTGCQSTVNNSGLYATEGSTINVTIQQEERTDTSTNVQIPQQPQREYDEYEQALIDEEKAILAFHNNIATLRCEQPCARAGKQYEIIDVVCKKPNLRYVFIDDYGQIAEINKVNFEPLEMAYVPSTIIEEEQPQEPVNVMPVEPVTPVVPEEPVNNDESSIEPQDYSNLEEWGNHYGEYAPDGYRFIAENNGYHHSTTYCNHINDGRNTKIIPQNEAYNTRKTCKHC